MSRRAKSPGIILTTLVACLMAAGGASASDESVSIESIITPEGALYKSYAEPVDITFEAHITAPPVSTDVRPVKTVSIHLPEGVTLDTGPVYSQIPSSSACPYFQAGSGYVDPSLHSWSLSTAVQTGCSGVLGNGSGTWYENGENATGPPGKTDIETVVFFGGRNTDHKSIINIVGGVGSRYYLMDGIYEDGVLALNIPHQDGDPTWGDFTFSLPGLDSDYEPFRGHSGFSLGTCPTGSWQTTASFEFSNASGPDSPVPAAPVTQPCSGADDPTRIFSVSSTGLGHGSITSQPNGIDCGSICSSDFLLNSEVTLTAHPDANSVLAGWSSPEVSGLCDDSSLTCAVTTQYFHSMQAKFDVKAPPGPIGFSINQSARFTDDPNVTLKVVWKQGEQNALIANDGGFGGAATRDLTGPEIPWTLDSGGGERLPKTVYLRFGDSTQTFTDDIILDETPPSLRSVAASKVSGRVRVRTRATDRTSGVASIQVGPKKSAALPAIKYRRTLFVKTHRKRVWVRVIDHAGNHSVWKKTRVR